MSSEHTAKIRALNEAFRKEPQRLGKLIVTRSVMELGDTFVAKALIAVQDFTAFDRGNDPYDERDFVPVVVDGHKVFGKIDYLDKKLEYGSEDPSDPTKTTRVLTIMLAEDY